MTQQLIIFTGLPGTGKSTVAEAVARRLQISVFAKDWLESVLLPLSGDSARTGSLAYQLLTTLADRQLSLGQSVILDSVASTESIRTSWHSLADTYGAQWKVIECICTDVELHRRSLHERKRNIPGWHELTWSDVERVKGYYVPWQEQRLVLDMACSLEENILKADEFLAS